MVQGTGRFAFALSGLLCLCCCLAGTAEAAPVYPFRHATVIVNEVYPEGRTANQPDWVELYNYGSEAVDLSNWLLTDENDAEAAHSYAIPDGTTLGAGEYMMFEQGESFPFGLGSNDEVQIFLPNGTRVDRLGWNGDKHRAGHSIGACPSADASDGVNANAFIPMPSPGAANTCGGAAFNGNKVGRVNVTAAEVRLDTRIVMEVLPFEASGALLLFGSSIEPGVDFFLLELVDGRVEFTWDAGRGAATVATQDYSELLLDGAPHTIHVVRSRATARLWVDDLTGDAVTAQLPGDTTSVDAAELQVGSVADFTETASGRGFVGAVGAFSINEQPLEIWGLKNPAAEYVGARGTRVRTTKYGFRKDSRIKMIIKPERRSGVLLHAHGTTPPRDKDFLSVELVEGELLFQFNPGRGKAAIRTSGLADTLFDGQWHVVVCERHHADGFIAVDGVRRGEGQSAGSTIAVDVEGYVQVALPDTFRNTEAQTGFVGQLRYASINDREVPVASPLAQNFNGRWVDELAPSDNDVKNAKKAATFDVLMRADKKDGLVFQWGTRVGSAEAPRGDFYAMELVGGAVRCAFDAGAGAADVRTGAEVWELLEDGDYHTVSCGRDQLRGTVSIDGEVVAEGSAPGSLVGLVPEGPVSFGGLADLAAYRFTATGKGFDGRVQGFWISGKEFAVVGSSQVEDVVGDLKKEDEVTVPDPDPATDDNDTGCLFKGNTGAETAAAAAERRTRRATAHAATAVGASSEASETQTKELTTDGSVETEWRAEGATDQWVSYDLGTARSVGSVGLWYQKKRVKGVRIEFGEAADGPWSEAGTYEMPFDPQDSEQTATLGDAQTARYWRVFVINSQSASWINLREVYFYAPGDGGGDGGDGGGDGGDGGGDGGASGDGGDGGGDGGDGGDGDGGDGGEDSVIPAGCATSPYYGGLVVLNEVQPRDIEGGADWFELYNAQEGEQDVSGWSVVDEGDARFVFPAGSTVPAGGLLVVMGGEGEAEFTFGLGKDDGLLLRDAAGAYVDSTTWSDKKLRAGLTWARCGEGDDAFQEDEATAGTANGCVSDPTPPEKEAPSGVNTEAGVVVNEVSPRSAAGAADWVEFYNGGDETVELTGWSWVDAGIGNVYAFPAGASLAAGAYLWMERDETGADGFTFGLGSADAVTLLDADFAVVDQTSWISGDAPEGATWGRCGAAGTFKTIKVPTPGAANDCTGATSGSSTGGGFPEPQAPRCGADNYRDEAREEALLECATEGSAPVLPPLGPEQYIGGFGAGLNRFQGVDHIKLCGTRDVYVWDHFGFRLKRWDLYAESADAKEVLTDDLIGRDIGQPDYRFPLPQDLPEINVFCGSQFDEADRRVFVLVYDDVTEEHHLYVRERPPADNREPACGEEKFREVNLFAGAKDTFVRSPHDAVVDVRGRFIFAERRQLLQCIKADMTGPCDDFGDAGGVVTVAEAARSLKWLDTDAEGFLYVSDKDNGRILKVSGAGEVVLAMGGSGPGDTDFVEQCEGVAVDAYGYIYGRDEGGERWHVFTPQGEYFTTFGSAGTKDTQNTNADGFVIDKRSNRMLIADADNYRWVAYNLCGAEPTKIGDFSNKGLPQATHVEPTFAWGGIQGSAQTPTNWDKINEMTFGRNGQLFVGDSYNRRIQIFTMDRDDSLPSAGDDELPADDGVFQYRGHFVGFIGEEAPALGDERYEPEDWQFVPVRIAPDEEYRVSSRFGIEAIKTLNGADVLLAVDHSAQRIVRFDYRAYTDAFEDASGSDYRHVQAYPALRPITNDEVMEATLADPDCAHLWPTVNGERWPLFADIAGLAVDKHDHLIISNNQNNELFKLAPTDPANPRTTGYKLVLWYQRREVDGDPLSPMLLDKAETVIYYDGLLQASGEPLGVDAVFVSAEKLSLLRPYDAETGVWLKSQVGRLQSGSVLQPGRFRADVEGAEVDPSTALLLAMDEENGRVIMYDLSADMRIDEEGVLKGTLTDKDLGFGAVGSFGGRGDKLGRHASPDGVTFSRSADTQLPDGKWVCVADQVNYRVQCYLYADIFAAIPRAAIPRLNRHFKQLKWASAQRAAAYLAAGGGAELQEEPDNDLPVDGRGDAALAAEVVAAARAARVAWVEVAEQTVAWYAKEVALREEKMAELEWEVEQAGATIGDDDFATYDPDDADARKVSEQYNSEVVLRNVALERQALGEEELASAEARVAAIV